MTRLQISTYKFRCKSSCTCNVSGVIRACCGVSSWLYLEKERCMSALVVTECDLWCEAKLRLWKRRIMCKLLDFVHYVQLCRLPIMRMH